MIAESVAIVALALGLDALFGDPRNRYHPTAWIGAVIARLAPAARHRNAAAERLGGVFVVVATAGLVLVALAALYLGISALASGWAAAIISVLAGSLLLKSTVAMRGMQLHAMAVVDSLGRGNLDSARASLAMIVKRDTGGLDKNRVISGVLESISENTVDGITGPLFYYAVFGLPGAFAYRVVNTADSMIGYKNAIFGNIGWFAAKCDTALNILPSRLTALLMIVSTAALGGDWRASYAVMIRDGRKTQSLNAGYPMAALAGALGTRLEKAGHYTLGDGDAELTREHVRFAIAVMKLTTLLFFAAIVMPAIFVMGAVLGA